MILLLIDDARVGKRGRNKEGRKKEKRKIK
jgi:hypothetical protein